ncbi:MAG: ABC transporter ATP-binding protein [Cardiobacteriaceae bacterium]|nr:ABC transporter ATP-binding protein [Cardiobacteriaceae bacterium]
MLTVKNLHYHRPKPLLQNLHFQLNAKEIVCLTGSNGVGKTTFLEILTGALQPQRGSIEKNFPPCRHWLGYLPDKPPLYPQLTVYDYLLLCAEMREISAPHKAVMQVMEMCELQHMQHQICALLSHGYKQRVGLAQAIIHQPPILILDEPSNGLDRNQRQKIIPLLQAQKTHSSILMTSHDVDEMIELADRIYVLHNKALWEILLPERKGIKHWFICPDESSAQALEARFLEYGTAVRDGRYLGLHELPKALWSELMNNPELIHYPHYPPLALQEKINHVECLNP